MDLLGSARRKVNEFQRGADKLLRIGKEESAVNDVRNEIRNKHQALGQIVVSLVKNGQINHPQVVNLAQQIAKLEERIQQHEKNIAAIRAEVAPTPPVSSAPGEQRALCPRCNTPVPVSAGFCFNCGQPMRGAPPPPPSQAAAPPARPAAPAPEPPQGTNAPSAAAARPDDETPGAPGRLPSEDVSPDRSELEAEAGLVCANCGAKLPPKTLFCLMCGVHVGS